MPQQRPGNQRLNSKASRACAVMGGRPRPADPAGAGEGDPLGEGSFSGF